MSHFTVMVIGEDPEKQLDPFDENVEFEKYLVEISTYSKEHFLQFAEKNIPKLKKALTVELVEKLQPALDDKEKFYTLYEIFKGELDEKLQATLDNDKKFDIFYDYLGMEYNGKDWIKNDAGEWCEYSTYNQNAKWDWYTLGGRWSGLIKLKEGAEGVQGTPGVFGNDIGIDQARKCDISNLEDLQTFAIIKDGEWYERGSMGWWGCVTDDVGDETWEAEFKKLIDDIPDDTLLSIYDCHI